MFWNRNKPTAPATATSVDKHFVDANIEQENQINKPTVLPDFDYSAQKKADIEEYIEKKGFFVRQSSGNDLLMTSNYAVWQIGPIGKLIRQNILRWWMDNIGRLKNVVTLDEVNNEPNLFSKYPVYAIQNDLQIPFGVARVKKSNREFFKTKDFMLSNDLSRQLYLEFYTTADSSREWLDSWKNYVQNMLLKVGLLEEKVLSLYETPATAGPVNSGGFYFERHNMKFAFPFGYEDIVHVSNRIDYDFQTFSDTTLAEQLKIKEGKKAEFPHIVEIKLDVEKLVLAVILNRFVCARFENKKNISIVFSPLISPIKCVIFASNNSPEINSIANHVFSILNVKYKSILENRGEIGRTINHYRQFGVPYIIMVDERTISSGNYNLFDCEQEEWLKLSSEQVFDHISKGVGI